MLGDTTSTNSLNKHCGKSKSPGPEMAMFNKFTNNWDKIDKQKFFQTSIFSDLLLENKAEEVVIEINKIASS